MSARRMLGPIARVFTAAIPVMLGAAPVLASGFIPMPDTVETLPSFRACLARLDAAYKQDRLAIAPRSLAGDGTTREVVLETLSNGIERKGRAKARYHRRIWYANGRTASHDPGQREVSHSWDMREMLCNGRKLTTRASNGFTQSTFETIETRGGESK